MEKKKRLRLSESTQLMILLLFILVVLLFFAFSSGRIFNKIFADQRSLYHVQHTFQTAEYYRMLGRRKEQREALGTLKGRYEALQTNSYAQQLSRIDPRFEKAIRSVQEDLGEYIIHLDGKGREEIPRGLVDRIHDDFGELKSHMYAYEKQQIQVIQMMNIFIVVVFFIIAVVTIYMDFQRRRQKRLKESLRFLNRHNLFAYENGSKRISYTIHDHVLQDLEMMRMSIETFADDLSSEAAQEQYEMMQSSLNDSISTLRDILDGLPVWDTTSLSFEENLRTMVERIGSKTTTEIEVVTIGLDNARLERREMEQLLSILQEALFNIGKHARAAHATVKALWARSNLNVTVEDDGVGFDPRKASGEDGAHLGFLSMRERAHAIGADFKVHSKPGRGTRLVIDLNKEESGE